MSDYVVCLDTSVILEIFDEALKAGQEPESWIGFKSLIDTKQAILLVPEIVLLEFDKGVRERLDIVKIKVHEILGCAGKEPFLQEQLEQATKIWRISRVNSITGMAKTFTDWLQPYEMEFTERIAHSTRKRIIARNFPVPYIDPNLSKADREKLKSQENQWLRDQDCAIIETLSDRLRGKEDKFILVFGTRDDGFGPIREDGYGNLDDTFRTGLPATQVFKDLRKLIDFVKTKEKVRFLSEKDIERIKKENETRESLERFTRRYHELLDKEILLGELATIINKPLDFSSFQPSPEPPEEQIPEEQIPEEQIPEEQIPEEQIPEEQIPEEQIPEEQIPEEPT